MFKESLGKLTLGQDLSAGEVTEFVENMRDDAVTEGGDRSRAPANGDPSAAA